MAGLISEKVLALMFLLPYTSHSQLRAVTELASNGGRNHIASGFEADLDAAEYALKALRIAREKNNGAA